MSDSPNFYITTLCGTQKSQPENHIINNIAKQFEGLRGVIAVSTDYVLNMPSPIDTNIFSYSRYISVINVSDDKFEDLMSYYRFIHKESKEESRYQTEIIRSIFYALILEIITEYEKMFSTEAAQNIRPTKLLESLGIRTIHQMPYGEHS